MKILDARGKVNERWVLPQLTRRSEPDRKVRRVVERILAEVRRGGDAALVRIHNRFAPKKINKGHLRVRGKFRAPGREIRRALLLAEKNIAEFARATRPHAWRKRNREGAVTGENFPALGRVGVYVPGGTAPLVSTALMTVVLARVAGVKEIVACTPGPVNPVLGWALQKAGATEIYQVGGAQAVSRSRSDRLESHLILRRVPMSIGLRICSLCREDIDEVRDAPSVFSGSACGNSSVVF